MSILFNGADQSLEMGNVLNPTVNMTVMAWIRRNSTGTRHEIVSKEQGSSGYELSVLASNVVEFGVANGSFPTATSTTTINTGIWYHVCGVRNSATGLLTMYVNGVLEGSGAAGAAPASSTNPLTIGNISLSSNGFRFFDGSIEDVRIYDRALSESEIQTIYACRGSDNINLNLQGRWPLNEYPDEYHLFPQIFNTQQNVSNTTASTLTLAYTVPSNIITDLPLTLYVCAGARAGSGSGGNTQASSCTFGATPLAKLNGVNSTSVFSNRVGTAIFQIQVTAGDSNTITVTWPGNTTTRFIHAFIVSNASPTSVSTSSSNTGNTTVNINSAGENRRAIMACMLDTTNAATAVGTGGVVSPAGNIIITNQTGSSCRFVTSSMYAVQSGSLNGVGITASGNNGSALCIVGAIGSSPVLQDLSSNGNNISLSNGGIYTDGTIRRRNYHRTT